MKLLLLVSSFLVFYFDTTSANPLSSIRCPEQVLISIECQENSESDFQLLTHLGRYRNAQAEVDSRTNNIICSYGVYEWVSRYKFSNGSDVVTASVSNLTELRRIAEVILSKGLRATYLNELVMPFSMVTFRPDDNRLRPERMFVFSGIESTFEKEGFAVETSDRNQVSTAVISDTYLKSKNTATDVYVTGSSCFIKIK